MTTKKRPAPPILTFPEQTDPGWFHFEIDGVDCVLPSVHTNLSLGAKLEARSARTASDQFATFMEIEADADTMSRLRALRGDQSDELFKHWREFEGASLPE